MTTEELAFCDAQKSLLLGAKKFVVRCLLERLRLLSGVLVVHNAAESVQQGCDLTHVQLTRLGGGRSRLLLPLPTDTAVAHIAHRTVAASLFDLRLGCDTVLLDLNNVVLRLQSK